MSTKRALEIIDATIKAVGTDEDWGTYADEFAEHAMGYGDMTAVLGFLLDAGYVEEGYLTAAIGHALADYAAEI